MRRQVVDLLARIHCLPAQPPYGGVNADLVTWIDGWCRHAVRWWSQQDGTTDDAARMAQTWYQRIRPLIANRAGSLIMLDGAPHHFVVDPDERVRLIDVAELQPGDPVMDLVVLRLHAPDIFKGVHPTEQRSRSIPAVGLSRPTRPVALRADRSYRYGIAGQGGSPRGRPDQLTGLVEPNGKARRPRARCLRAGSPKNDSWWYAWYPRVVR